MTKSLQELAREIAEDYNRDRVAFSACMKMARAVIGMAFDAGWERRDQYLSGGPMVLGCYLHGEEKETWLKSLDREDKTSISQTRRNPICVSKSSESEAQDDKPGEQK